MCLLLRKRPGLVISRYRVALVSLTTCGAYLRRYSYASTLLHLRPVLHACMALYLRTYSWVNNAQSGRVSCVVVQTGCAHSRWAKQDYARTGLAELFSMWCEVRGSNSHAVRRMVLSHVRIPIPPTSHVKALRLSKKGNCPRSGSNRHVLTDQRF